jgi:hypothetical protein
MTSHIFKLAQMSLVALAFVPLGLTFNVGAASAKLNTTQNIQHNLPAKNIIAKVDPDNSIATSNNRDRSMEYVKKGLLVQQEAGKEQEAMLYYYEAVKIDTTNPMAFMAAGNLLGDTDEGITCVKAAALLFQAEENEEGYQLAINWLTERGIAQ